MSVLLDMYSDIIQARESLESALVEAAKFPDEADDWDALTTMTLNIVHALAALKVPAEITEAVEAEEAALYESECLADRASY